MFEDDFPFSRVDILVLEGGMIAFLVAIIIKFSFWMGEFNFSSQHKKWLIDALAERSVA